MSVIAEIPVSRRIWRGSDNPGLPVGLWIAQQVILGDASGGDQTIEIIMSREGGRTGGFYYNLEQLEAHMTSEAVDGLDMAIIAINWERTGSFGLANRQWVAQVFDNNNGASALAYDRLPRFPIFLGATSVVPAISTSLNIETDNQDGVTLVVTAQGYVWEPRSLEAQGGLSRPPWSIYGS